MNVKNRICKKKSNLTRSPDTTNLIFNIKTITLFNNKMYTQITLDSFTLKCYFRQY